MANTKVCKIKELKTRRPGSLKLLLFTVSALLLGVSCSKAPATTGSGEGDKLPELNLVRFDGSTLSSSELSGKTVVINFWTS